MDANGIAGLKQMNGEGEILLCPRLQNLQIECYCVPSRPNLTHFAKDIITLRAECGSPLKVFTFFEHRTDPGRKFELIGRDGGFTIEESNLAWGSRKFSLDF